MTKNWACYCLMHRSRIRRRTPPLRRTLGKTVIRTNRERAQIPARSWCCLETLMPNMLPVNMGNAAGIAHDSGGRLALLVRDADCQRCDARLSAVLADKRPVDIYLVDSEGSDQKLRNWAQQHRISPIKYASAASPWTTMQAAGCATATASCRFFSSKRKADGISQRSNPRVVAKCRQLCGVNQYAKRAVGLSESRSAAWRSSWVALLTCVGWIIAPAATWHAPIALDNQRRG